MVEQADGSVDMDAGFMARADTPVISWSTRRRMSYICLWSFIVVSFLLLLAITTLSIPDTRLEQLVTVYSYFAMGCLSVVLGYFGFTTLPFIGRSK